MCVCVFVIYLRMIYYSPSGEKSAREFTLAHYYCQGECKVAGKNTNFVYINDKEENEHREPDHAHLRLCKKYLSTHQ